MKSTSKNEDDTKQYAVPIITEELENRLKLNFYFSLQGVASGRVPKSYSAIHSPYCENEILIKFYCKLYSPLKRSPSFPSFVSAFHIEDEPKPALEFYMFKRKTQSKKNPWCFQGVYEKLASQSFVDLAES